MKKIFENVCVLVACVILSVFAFLATSSTTIKDTVFCVENGVYYHRHGDCAVCEKSHDKDRKIYVSTKAYAESKLFLPCRKCAK